MEFFDSHAHYNDEKFDQDLDEIIMKNYNDGIKNITCVGYGLESSKKAIEISEEYGFIYSTCGISPNDLSENVEQDLIEIENMAKHEKVVAIGEIGLDYYWNKENKDKQKEIFVKQIEIANRLDLPIVIHTRDAVMDTLDIVKNKMKCNKKGIFHCCPHNVELIKEAVKLGYYISFSGNITFKSAKPYDSIKQVPIDKLLIETDSPYLTPEPFRGKRNNPENVKLVAEKVAEILNITVEEVAKITSDNAKRAFFRTK